MATRTYDGLRPASDDRYGYGLRAVVASVHVGRLLEHQRIRTVGMSLFAAVLYTCFDPVTSCILDKGYNRLRAQRDSLLGNKLCRPTSPKVLRLPRGAFTTVDVNRTVDGLLCSVEARMWPMELAPRAMRTCSRDALFFILRWFLRGSIPDGR